MGIRFSADEVFAVAQAIEVNGANFYHAASQLVPKGQQSDLLEELARWEKVHEEAFAQMRSAIAAGPAETETYDPLGEAAMYLQSLADSRVFKPGDDPLKRLGPKPTSRAILSTALDMEKESIVFYVGIKDFVPHAESKAKIDAIIKEEMKHVSLLTRELAELK